MLNLILSNLLIITNFFIPSQDNCGYFTDSTNISGQIIIASGPELDASRNLGIYVPKFIWAVDHSKIGEGFGVPRPETNSIHMGLDIFPGEGTKIIASHDGVVTKVEYGTGPFGYMVEIYDGYEYSTLYAHMIAGSFEQYGISVGSQVKQGQVIGLVGSTGRSTAPHLHFEIRDFGVQVDPEPIMKQYATG